MNLDTKHTNTFPALKLIAPMVFVYLAVLALVDQVFYPEPTLSWIFYFIIGLDALVILPLTYTRSIQQVLGKALIPLIIALLIIVPVFSTFMSTVGQEEPVSVELSQPGAPGSGAPAGGGPEMEMLRLIPLTFTALVLVAWQYRMPHVFGFTFFTILVSAVILNVTINFLFWVRNLYNRVIKNSILEFCVRLSVLSIK